MERRGCPQHRLFVLSARLSIQALRTALLIPLIARSIYLVMTFELLTDARPATHVHPSHTLLQWSRHWSEAVPHFTPHPEIHVTCFTFGRRQG